MRAWPIKPRAASGWLWVAPPRPTRSWQTTKQKGIMESPHHIQRPCGSSWISPGQPRHTMTATARPKDYKKERVVRWDSHNQDQLDQQPKDGQEPVDISVSIVEWRTAEAHLEVAFRVGSHCEGINARVEDTDILVAGNGSHQVSDGQCCAELVVNLGNLQPTKNGCCSQAGP